MADIDDAVAASPTESNVLVAGPGTGKSYRLHQRVLSLESQGIPRREMVLLTLTNETVRSLRERLADPAASTVHSFALGKLNAMGAASRKRIADRWEQRELVRVDMKMLAAAAGYAFRVDQVDKFLTALGAGFRDTMAARATPTPGEAVLRLTWQRVRDFVQLRLMDELAYDLRGLLEAGSPLPNPAKAILVDEYQDLTPEELRLIHAMANSSGAGVFAAGDDRQSIYGFREADPLGLNSFATVYGTPGPVYLSESHRCPITVVDLAEKVAESMPAVPGLTGRPRLTSNPSLGAGEVQVISFRSPAAECAWVLADIRRRLRTSDAKHIAVIVPRDTDFYLREFSRQAASEHIDVTLVDPRGHPTIADEDGVRLAYALLRLSADEDDELAWRGVLHLTRGIGASVIETLYASGADRISVALRARSPFDTGIESVLKRVNAAIQDIETATDAASVRAAVDTAVASLAPGKSVGWDEVETAIGKDPAAPPAGAPDEVACGELRALAGAGAGDRVWAANEVGLYTIFGAKGQQWDHVYVVGAYAQAFTDRAVLADGLRLLYVALTRARQSLTVTYPAIIRFTQLAQRLRTDRSELLPQFAEACADLRITVSRDPARPA